MDLNLFMVVQRKKREEAGAFFPLLHLDYFFLELSSGKSS